MIGGLLVLLLISSWWKQSIINMKLRDHLSHSYLQAYRQLKTNNTFDNKIEISK